MENPNASSLNWGATPASQYENWYGIIHHQREPIAFWFRYTMTAFETNRAPEARLWAVVFDKTHPNHNQIRTMRFELGQIRLTNAPFRLELGQLGLLTTEAATGEPSKDDAAVSWQLSFDPTPLTYASVPLPSIAQSPTGNLSNNNLKANGHLVVGDRSIDFVNAPSHRGHTWGTKMPLRWIWGHCNTFENEPDAVFEGVSFQAQSETGVRAPLTSFYLRYHDRNYFFSTLAHLTTTNQSKQGPDFWRFSGTCDDIRIEGELNPDPEQTHYVRYLDVDETELFNRNSCLGRGEIAVFRKRSGTWRLEAELRATDTVAFEIVDRNADGHEYRPRFS